jgi:hypothetical protein
VWPQRAQANLQSLAAPNAAQLFGTWSWPEGAAVNDNTFCRFVFPTGDWQHVNFNYTQLSVYSDGTYSLTQEYTQHPDNYFFCSPMQGKIHVQLTLNSADGSKILLQEFVSPPLIQQQDVRQNWSAGPFGPDPRIVDKRFFDNAHPADWTANVH